MLVALKDGACYLWRVTEYERTRMQTDYGMKAVEVNITSHLSVDRMGGCMPALTLGVLKTHKWALCLAVKSQMKMLDM